MVEALQCAAWVTTDRVPALHLLEQTELSFKFPCCYTTVLLLKGLLVLKQWRPSTFLLLCWYNCPYYRHISTHTHVFKYTHTLQHFNCSNGMLTTWPSRICPCFYRSLRLEAAATSEGRGVHVVHLMTWFNSLPISVASSIHTLKCQKATAIFAAAGFSKGGAIITCLSLSLACH